jgi:hypothetical protein
MFRLLQAVVRLHKENKKFQYTIRNVYCALYIVHLKLYLFIETDDVLF